MIVYTGSFTITVAMSKIDNFAFQDISAVKSFVVFRLRNSKTADHFGKAKTIAELRKLFYFPEFLLSTVNKCLSCLQLKRAPSKFLKPALQPLSSETSYPEELLRINLVGPLPSPHY